MKKNLPIAELLSAASMCLLPMAASAQTPSAPSTTSAPEAASQAATPSAPSIPEAPSIPTSPSQPSGYPRTGSTWPGTTFEPAGTQASMVSSGEELPPFQFRVMAGVEHQSNVLATPTGSKSDTIGFAGIGFRADRRLGLQRFRADVEANTYKYSSESQLDYSVFNYALAWDWSVTTKLHGVISADQKEYSEVSTDPVTFNNRVGKRTERAQGADAVYELGAAWRIMGGFAHTEASSTLPATWDSSPSVNSARVGAGYVFGSGTTLYAHYREGKGNYNDPTPGAATGDFTEHETDLQLTWPITVKTAVDARIGNLRRSNDVSKQNDFSGTVGSVGVRWDITAKTRLAAGYNRDLSAPGFGSGGYTQSDRFYLGPIWKATAQVAVNARYEHVNRDSKNVPAGSSGLGNETTQVLSAGVDWEPRRWLAISGYVRTEKTDSSLNSGFRNTAIGAAAKAYF